MITTLETFNSRLSLDRITTVDLPTVVGIFFPKSLSKKDKVFKRECCFVVLTAIPDLLIQTDLPRSMKNVAAHLHKLNDQFYNK